MTTANIIADQLFKAGVRKVFGIPGGASIPWIEAFRKRGIEFVLVSNEASAGVMAAVSARLTGVTGVCHATFGPGATNISTGTGCAFLDRDPVIVLTSEMNDAMKARTVQMNINHQNLFAPVTKATFRISPANAADSIGKALRICREEYPGPVHLGLPDDIAGSNSDPGTDNYQGPAKVNHQENTSEIISLLSRSYKPVIAAGHTASRLSAGRALQEFLEKYPVPVVTTPMAGEILPHDHPCFAGVLFHALSDRLRPLFKECDLVIGLGYDQVEFNYESWMPDVPLVHLDTKINDLPAKKDIYGYEGYPDDWFTILGNIRKPSARNNIIRMIRNEMKEKFEKNTSPFGPVSVLKILKHQLPVDSIVTSDVGSHLHVLGQFWRTGAGSQIIMSNGWSGMGFGIPAAIAAGIHRPLSRTVCITGDGGFLMTAGEIATARRLDLPVVIIVLSDGEMNLIKLKQSWKKVPAEGTILYDGDLFGSDKFLGIRVIRADNVQKMKKAVTTALSLNEPVIINAVIDPAVYEHLIVKQ
jgi:acetolactate synthase-1/2/3 large subunit